MRITWTLASVVFSAGCLTEGSKRAYTVDDYMGDPAVAAVEPEPVDPTAKHELDFSYTEPQLKPETPLATDDDTPSSGEGLTQLLKENSRAILNAATHVETVRYSQGSAVAKGRPGDQSYARRILSILFDDERVADWGGPLCQTFEPSVGFRLQGAKGSAELLLSFRCSELQLHVKDQSGNVLQVLRADFPEDKGGRQELLGVSQEAFPKDLLLH